VVSPGNVKRLAGEREDAVKEFRLAIARVSTKIERYLCELGDHKRPPRRGLWPLLRRCERCGRRWA
jgi:hypothetical protein